MSTSARRFDYATRENTIDCLFDCLNCELRDINYNKVVKKDEYTILTFTKPNIPAEQIHREGNKKFQTSATWLITNNCG